MFTNTVKAEWPEGEPRKMWIIEPLSYVDSMEVEWNVPSGAVINGISTPKILWSIMGSPYVGKARRASVFHDYYYQSREVEKSLVDAMFYEAMKTDGVPHIKAHLMYLALQSTGETWEEYDNFEELPDDYGE